MGSGPLDNFTHPIATLSMPLPMTSHGPVSLCGYDILLADNGNWKTGVNGVSLPWRTLCAL